MFTKRAFQRGEIVWIADDLDLKLSLADYQLLTPFQREKVNTYGYLDDRSWIIIPWDEGKYVNHSCAPNSTSLAEFDNISILLRDLGTGEEILEDYYSYCGHFESFRCLCGAPNCRGYIRQEDSFEPGLRVSLADMAPPIVNLPQPLLEVHSDEKARLLALLETYGGVLKRRQESNGQFSRY